MNCIQTVETLPIASADLKSQIVTSRPEQEGNRSPSVTGPKSHRHFRRFAYAGQQFSVVIDAIKQLIVKDTQQKTQPKRRIGFHL